MRTRLLFILLVSTSAKATPLVGQLEALHSLTTTLKNSVSKPQIVEQVSASRLHSKQVNNEEMLTKDSLRARRSSTYSPFTSDPYDLGPIGQCSSPQLDICNFADDYTVPEYVARTVYNYNNVLNNLERQLRSLDGSGCANKMTDFMCKELISPQCISNTTVRYSSGVQTVSSARCTSCIMSNIERVIPSKKRG